MKEKDYSSYILPIGGLVLFYLVAVRFGLIKSAGAEMREREQLFKDYFSPMYLANLLKKKGNRVTIFSKDALDKYVKQIYDSKRFYGDDESLFFSVLKRIQYKSQVSQIADAFAKKYKEDLAFFLSNNFLNAEELNRVYEYTDKLPSGLK